MATPAVGIVGMAALRKDLKRLSDDVTGPLYKAMKEAGREVAEPVVAATRSALPHVTGRLANTVRASGTKTGASVRMGTKSVPWAGWVEFGGTRRQGPHNRAARPFNPQGRYLFPAARGDAARAAQAYAAALETVFAQSGIWTNTTGDGKAVHD